MEGLVHVFLVSYPGQGHVNPLLSLGKLLASKGLLVTFSTPETGKRMVTESSITDEPTPFGDGSISFEFFEDGWEEHDPRHVDLYSYAPQLERVGKAVLPRMLKAHRDGGRPVSCVINNPFVPWVPEVATNLASLVPCSGFNRVLASQYVTTITVAQFHSLAKPSPEKTSPCQLCLC
ncbi:hypothetical protein RJ640_018704 [Escallonia rubra]|uniref:Uncharacterized protein n=1 Tax=Escallonia rubra TaxID=112253 RepID=A0AA88RHE8_9ASTE|nr:hypothetical protein RJ640_018704 [Escallonia rubra]